MGRMKSGRFWTLAGAILALAGPAVSEIMGTLGSVARDMQDQRSGK